MQFAQPGDGGSFEVDCASEPRTHLMRNQPKMASAWFEDLAMNMGPDISVDEAVPEAPMKASADLIEPRAATAAAPLAGLVTCEALLGADRAFPVHRCLNLPMSRWPLCQLPLFGASETTRPTLPTFPSYRTD
jgi:hypothetical protein